MFSLPEDKAEGDLMVFFIYIMGAFNEGRAKLLEVHSERKEAIDTGLQPRKFQLDVRKKFFTIRMVTDWNRRPGGPRSLHPWRCSKPAWMQS